MRMFNKSDHTLFAANARTPPSSSLRGASNSDLFGTDAAVSMAIACPVKTSGRALTCEQMSRTIRGAQLRSIVTLSDTTIYELEQQAWFPRRFYLTARCVGRLPQPDRDSQVLRSQIATTKHNNMMALQNLSPSFLLEVTTRPLPDLTMSQGNGSRFTSGRNSRTIREKRAR